MATDPAPRSKRGGSVTGVREVGADATESSPYRPGTVIDKKFQLLRRIGEGGMGAVWVAHNRVLDVQVGIKLISLSQSSDRMTLARRLLDEARSAARLGHPAVLKIHEFGVTDHGDPFIAMELLDGEDLGRVLQREQRLPVTEALQLVLPIAHGLAAAHDKGIVHRDVKPENIFLAKDDDEVIRPKLVDFGIARIADSPTKNTVDGAALGTPDYMSPELARGETAGPASDIWSFAVLIYELVSGSCPFSGSNYNALMQSIISDSPVALSERGVDDRELWAIVERGLQKSPEQRFASMRELGEHLARLLLARGVSEDVSHTALRRQWLRDTASNPTEASGAMPLPEGAMPSPTPAPVTESRRPSAPPASSEHDDQESSRLAAIAEMNRGGDPEEVWRRQEQRRQWMIGAVAVGLAIGLVLSILIGTGIL